jgi:2,4-dienoyl-CoA reductase-like NADH-dependent reductase (Old Yellow Enzyme family)
MELKNRLVRSATHEGMCDSDGFPTQPLFKLYERLAKGGIGLIITGYSFVSRECTDFCSRGDNGKKDHGKHHQQWLSGLHISMSIPHSGSKVSRKNLFFSYL